MDASGPTAWRGRACPDALLLELALLPRRTRSEALSGLSQALEHATRFLGVVRASVFGLMPGTKTTHCLAQYDATLGRRFAPAELTGITPPRELARFVEMARDEQRNLRGALLAPTEGSGAALALVVPLFVADDLVGGLSLEHSDPGRRFSPEERSFAQKLADVAAGFVWAVLREQELVRIERAAELYRGVVEDQTDLIFRTNRKGHIVFVNRAALEFSGMPEHEVIGKHVLDFAPEEDRAFIAQENTLITPEHPVIRYEHRGVRADGAIVLLSWLIRGLFDEQGRIAEYQCIGRDVTREREREARMQEAQRLESLAVLSGGIAHDFNNLLTPIVGYTDALMHDPTLTPKHKARLEEMLKAGRRAQQLVRQILMFGRKESERVTLIAATPAIRETLDFLRASLPARIELETHVDGDCGSIHAQPSDLYQILSNLCTNAYQAMPAGGKLTVSASKITLRRGGADVPYLQIIVRDTGHGIPPEVRERIFEPFFTTKRIGQGTGLGLSTVHGRVTALGGTIDVQSKVSEGTSFVVHLPSATRATRVGTEVEARSGEARARILVVDDEPSVTGLLRDMLEGLGYAVDVAHSANEGLALFLANPESFALVLTDLTMPHVSGIELAWRAHQASPDTPVLLMTGFGDILTREDLEAGHILRVIKKPFSTEEVGKVVAQALVERDEKG